MNLIQETHESMMPDSMSRNAGSPQIYISEHMDGHMSI